MATFFIIVGVLTFIEMSIMMTLELLDRRRRP